VILPRFATDDNIRALWTLCQSARWIVDKLSTPECRLPLHVVYKTVGLMSDDLYNKVNGREES
jgi:hypothetical protein